MARDSGAAGVALRIHRLFADAPAAERRVTVLLRDTRSQSAANNSFLEESERVWDASACSINERLEAFAKYVSRKSLTKFLARAEAFKRQLTIHGSVVELGVGRGANLFCWLHLTSILEPTNYTRRIYGFNTFSGIPSVSAEDLAGGFVSEEITPRGFAVVEDMEGHIVRAAQMHDKTRFLGHIPKIAVVPGDIEITVPRFLREHPELIISLLHIDTDLYAPTKTALTLLLPRVPRGGMIICDELNDARFPGESSALHELLAFSSIKLERVEFCPSFAFWERQ